jgi:HPt (histidine-containing phosphotransfer) domain-containing protein
MSKPNEFSPGLLLRGFTVPALLRNFKLVAFGIDSVMLYPGTEELVDALNKAGVMVQLAIGEIMDADEKLNLFLTACREAGITPAQCIVVGRADHDLPMLRMAGLSVAYRAAPAVAAEAMVCIESGGLDRLLEVLALHVADAPPGLDLSVLEKLVNHDEAKFRKFALLFMDSVETVMKAVDDAIAQHDLAALAAMGHRAKSTAMNIGATQFSAQCLLLEQTAKANDPAAIEVARTLRPLFATICQAIALRLA